jgi:type IV secretory pathway VirB10-like protein
MANPIQLPQGRRRWHGPAPWKVVAVIVALAGLSGAMLYYGRDLMGYFIEKKPKPTRNATGEPMSPATFVKESSNGMPPGAPIDQAALKREEQYRKTIEEAQAMNQRLMARLEALQAAQKDKTPAQATPRPQKPEKPPEPKKISREKAVFLVRDRSKDGLARHATHVLDTWEFIPCQLETLIHSEIPGKFTVKVKRDVFDSATHQHVLVKAGQRVGAEAKTADLLFGNKRIPTFALSYNLPDGTPVDLGEAPILDATGANGLTGEVDNHVWRLVWTSVFIGGLRGGQQVLQQTVGRDGAGPIIGGIAREGHQVTQQLLGRAQDTRPTITAQPGEGCNIMVTKPLALPAVASD